MCRIRIGAVRRAASLRFWRGSSEAVQPFRRSFADVSGELSRRFGRLRERVRAVLSLRFSAGGRSPLWTVSLFFRLRTALCAMFSFVLIRSWIFPEARGIPAFFADCPLPPFAGGFSAGFQRAYPREVSVSFLRRQVRQRAMRKCI